MQHVGVAENDMRLSTNRTPRIRRRVAVVGEDPNPRVRIGRHQFRQCLQFSQLILRERLRREEVQRACRRILEDRVQNGSVVAERLSGRGRRDRDDVASGEHVIEGFGLMGVELFDPADRKCRPEPRVRAVGIWPERGGDCGQPMGRCDDRIRLAAKRSPRSGQPAEGLLQ